VSQLVWHKKDLSMVTSPYIRKKLDVYLFDYFEPHEEFFSYLAAVIITDDRATNLALTAFSSEGSFTCHTYCDTGPRLLWLVVNLKDP
jgi:hypothetical protein